MPRSPSALLLRPETRTLSVLPSVRTRIHALNNDVAAYSRPLDVTVAFRKDGIDLRHVYSTRMTVDIGNNAKIRIAQVPSSVLARILRCWSSGVSVYDPVAGLVASLPSTGTILVVDIWTSEVDATNALVSAHIAPIVHPVLIAHISPVSNIASIEAISTNAPIAQNTTIATIVPSAPNAHVYPIAQAVPSASPRGPRPQCERAPLLQIDQPSPTGLCASPSVTLRAHPVPSVSSAQAVLRDHSSTALSPRALPSVLSCHPHVTPSQEQGVNSCWATGYVPLYYDPLNPAPTSASYTSGSAGVRFMRQPVEVQQRKMKENQQYALILQHNAFLDSLLTSTTPAAAAAFANAYPPS